MTTAPGSPNRPPRGRRDKPNHRRRARIAAEMKARAYQLWLASEIMSAEADLAWRLYQAAEALYEHHLGHWLDEKKQGTAA